MNLFCIFIDGHQNHGIGVSVPGFVTAVNTNQKNVVNIAAVWNLNVLCLVGNLGLQCIGLLLGQSRALGFYFRGLIDCNFVIAHIITLIVVVIDYRIYANEHDQHNYKKNRKDIDPAKLLLFLSGRTAS